MEKEQTPGSLVYVNDSMEGFSRTGENPDFIYTDLEGNKSRMLKYWIVFQDW